MVVVAYFFFFNYEINRIIQPRLNPLNRELLPSTKIQDGHTDTKFKMAANVAKQPGNNNTARTGPFQGANLPLSGTITFVNFYKIIMQFFALFQHL